jgi:hypothetical protein
MFAIHVDEQRIIRQVCIFIIKNSFNEVVLFHALRQDLRQYQTYAPRLPLFASVKCTYHILLKVLLLQGNFKLELDFGVIGFILGFTVATVFARKCLFLNKSAGCAHPIMKMIS